MNTTEKLDLSALPRPKMNLGGLDGNAFAVIAAVRKELKRAGWTHPQVMAFTEEAASGDYNTVLATCLKYTR